MKKVMCFPVICCLVFQATAQHNIFFKKEKPKYAVVSKRTQQLKNDQQQLPSPMSLYATALEVNRSFSWYMPKSYVANNSNTILYILGLGGSILGSIYANKLHYHYTGDIIAPTIDYRQNTH